MEKIEICKDALAIAAQLGRLDLVSILVAVIGVVVPLAGIFALFNVKSKAEKLAKDEAKKIAKKVAEETANTYLQAEMPNILEDYKSFILHSTKNDMKRAADLADQIAEAQED